MPNQYPFELSDLNKELEGEFDPGEELDDEDFEEIKAELPKRSSFPVRVFICALIKDLLDIASLGLLGTFFNIILWIIITKYLWGKIGFIKKWMYRRYIFTRILEFIPWINMIPQNTIFVLRGYAKEKKQIDKVLTAIEKLIIRSQTGGGFKAETLERFV
jgi:hypothetical protein